MTDPFAAMVCDLYPKLARFYGYSSRAIPSGRAAAADAVEPVPVSSKADIAIAGGVRHG